MTLNRLQTFVESRAFRTVIILLILINSLSLGLDSYLDTKEERALLLTVDRVIVWIFVVELGLRMVAHRLNFFRDPSSLFDLSVVAIALVPSNEAFESFAVLRALRVLLVMRFITAFPRLRRVLDAFVLAFPSIMCIGAILAIVFYIFAIMATRLYGVDNPEWFGSLHVSLFTLFQIMTQDNWTDVVREIMTTRPLAWLFFVIYILVTTFIILNLFIGVIVSSLQEVQETEKKEEDSLKKIEAELKKIHKKINSLKSN